MKAIPGTIAVLVACVLLGCTSGGSMVTQVVETQQPSTGQPQQQAPAVDPGLFSIPAPSEIKGISYTEEDLFRIGSDYVEELTPQLFTVSGDNMLFTPDWDRATPVNANLSFVNYAFMMDGYDRDSTLRFSWAQTGTNFRDGWVGIANWNLDRWDWYKLPEGDVMAADFDGCFRATDSNMVITVLFIGHDIWELEDCRVGAPPGAPVPPTNLTASQSDYLNQITITWDQPFGATDYIIYRDNQEDPIATVGDVDTYDDTTLTDLAPHTYWVIASNEFGPSGFSDSVIGWCASCIPPTDVEASDGLYVDHVEVTWTAEESADGYEIFRDEEPSAVAVVGDVESWSDFGVVDTGNHWYKIRSFNTVGFSKFSGSDAGFLGSPIPPLAPTNLQATDGTHIDRVELTWTKADDTIGYEIYRDLQALPIETVGDVDTWNDTTLIDNLEHTYWLKSINASGTSDFSMPDIGHLAACDPPTNVQATDGEYTTKIVITWTKSADAEGYKVFRDSQLSPPVATLGDVDTYDDLTIVDTGNHTYWVKGYISTGDSAFSEPDVGFMREIAIPTIPQNLVASDGTHTDKVEVTWDVVEDAAEYEVFRDLQVAPIATVYTNSFDDTTLTNYDPHEYWVRAKNSMGTSDFSDSDTGYMGTPTDPPEAPTNLQASDGTHNDKVVLTWNASASATGYKIYRDSQTTPILTGSRRPTSPATAISVTATQGTCPPRAPRRSRRRTSRPATVPTLTRSS